jgi:hypothetical protein
MVRSRSPRHYLNFPAVVASLAVGLLAGCALDVDHSKLKSTTFSPVTRGGSSFVLGADLDPEPETGWVPTLTKGTRWTQVGTTPMGAVYATQDQVVTLVAAHRQEARLVVRDRRIVGFHLPVEQKFVAVTEPVSIDQTEP